MTFFGTPYPYQQEAIDKMVDEGQMLLGLVMGAGKATLSTTPVLTPDGWVPVKDIHVGDFVVGSDGLPTKVLGVYPQGVRPCFRVTFNDGTSTVVDEDHLWYLESPADRHCGRQGKVLETWKLADPTHVEPGHGRDGKPFRTFFRDRHGNNRWSIPIGSPPVLAEQHLPIDPYTLGALLGDGSFKKSSTALFCHADDVAEMASLVVGASEPKDSKTCWSFSVPGLLPALRELDLAGTKAHTKFIPHRYLLGTPLQRLAVLQGLMDTDGYTGKKGTVEFVSVSQQLAQDVADLARSLGAYAYMRKKTTTCMYKGAKVYGVAWRVTFKMSTYTPFRLSRKVASYSRQKKYQPLRVITDIAPVDPADTTCIAVEASDHLYVIEHYIVTHNTMVSIAAIEALHDAGEVTRCLVVVPSSLKYQWLSEIKKFTDARATVIDGTPQQRKNLWRAALSSRFVIINPESLIKDMEAVKKQRFEAIVVDEATVLKTRTSQRSRAIKKLAAPIYYRFALTGQPIENRPEELFSIMEFVDKSVLGNFREFDLTFIVRDSFGKPIRYRNLDALNKAMEHRLIRKTRADIADQLPEVISQVITVPFDPRGEVAYRRIAADLLAQIQQAVSSHGKGFNLWAHYNGGGGDEAQGQIMSRLTVLRMLCDNPELVLRSAAEFNDPRTKAGSQYAADIVSNGWLTNVTKAPKLDAVTDYIQEILDEDPTNKVVLFSFFKNNLRMIQKATEKMTGSVLFMGGMDSPEREKAKKQFATDPNTRLFLSSDAGGYGVDLPMANYCVYSNTMILRSDLQWVPAKDLRPGDSIVGVEEHRRGKGMPRRFELGTVTTNTLDSRECLRVTFSNGEGLTVTPEHKMLVKHGHGWTWRQAQHLLPGWRVSKAFDTWKQMDSYDAGWVAGMLDGEGCISRTGNGLALTFSQNPGPALDKFLRLAHEFGFDFRNSGRKDNHCQQYVLRGGKSEVARFLGTVGSDRLISKWASLVGNHKVMAVDTPAIVSVEPCGETEISILNTTCRTYIADGYVQHNCISYDLPWSSGKLEQREARIIRLSSTFPHVTIASFVMRGSIEERQYEMLTHKRKVNEAFVDGMHHAKGTMEIDLSSLSSFLRDGGL